MRYEVRLSQRALRQLRSLDSVMKRRIVSKLEELGDDPFPRGVVKLPSKDGLYRVRVGDYRILYEVIAYQKMVLVDKIDHRSGVYGP